MPTLKPKALSLRARAPRVRHKGHRHKPLLPHLRRKGLWSIGRLLGPARRAEGQRGAQEPRAVGEAVDEERQRAREDLASTFFGIS